MDSVNDQGRISDIEDNLTRRQDLLLIDRNVTNEKRGTCGKVKRIRMKERLERRGKKKKGPKLVRMFYQQEPV